MTVTLHATACPPTLSLPLHWLMATGAVWPPVPTWASRQSNGDPGRAQPPRPGWAACPPQCWPGSGRRGVGTGPGSTGVTGATGAKASAAIGSVSASYDSGSARARPRRRCTATGLGSAPLSDCHHDRHLHRDRAGTGAVDAAGASGAAATPSATTSRRAPTTVRQPVARRGASGSPVADSGRPDATFGKGGVVHGTNCQCQGDPTEQRPDIEGALFGDRYMARGRRGGHGELGYSHLTPSSSSLCDEGRHCAVTGFTTVRQLDNDVWRTPSRREDQSGGGAPRPLPVHELVEEAAEAVGRFEGEVRVEQHPVSLELSTVRRPGSPRPGGPG